MRSFFYRNFGDLMTLRSKLIGASLLSTFVIFVLSGIVIYGSSRQELEDELGRRLISIGTTASSFLSKSVDAKQITRIDGTKKRVLKRLSKKLLDLKSQTGVERAFLFDRNLKCIVDTNDTPFGENLYVLGPHQKEIDLAFNGENTSSVLFSKPGGFDKIGFVPVRDTQLGENAEVVAIIGIVGSAAYFEILNDLFKVLSVLFVFGVLLAVAISSYLSRRITEPVKELVQAAQKVGRGELAESVHIHTNDEIGLLGKAFEKMRIDILQRDEQMQMMLSGIAHEVRNPLGGMALFLGLLREDLAQEGDEGLSKLGQVDKIQRELFYLEDVVSNFLDFAKNTPLSVESFSVHTFLAEIVELLEADASGNNVVLTVEVDSSLKMTGDKEKIRGAIINIVRNAYQSCQRSGKVYITASKSPDSAERCIRVQDEGCGMDEATIKSVLTPFFTTKEQGSGLGLALANRIIGQHGGRLKIESEVGKGTVVSCTLPFDDSIQMEDKIPEGWLG